MPEEQIEAEGQQKPTGLGVRNIGEPLRFSDVEDFAGFSAEPGKGGKTIKVWTRLALTSDEPLFHRLVESLAGVVTHMAWLSKRARLSTYGEQIQCFLC